MKLENLQKKTVKNTIISVTEKCCGFSKTNI